MPKVDFITFVHWRDYKKLAEPGELARRVASHDRMFDNVIVVRQRLRDVEGADSVHYGVNVEVETEDYPDILDTFHIPAEDPIADEKTHGPSAPHYWKWHVINHLIGLKVSDADYVVFSDSDCRIAQSGSPSWVDVGIELLRGHQDILIVAPSDGGSMAERRLRTRYGVVRLTQNISQQMFMCNRHRMLEVDFAVPWNWEYTAPGGPFQEYYYMLEGRMWRYMDKHGLYRAILPDTWRYWHDAWH